MRTRSLRSRRASKGVVSVEMALLLPILLALALPAYDIARNIQAQMILINVSREGASLSSRASLTYPMQTIMSSLTATTPPLNMNAHGMIYITEIMGNNNCDSNGNNCTGVVVAQYRWNGGNYYPASQLWNCGNSGTRWATDGTGSCGGIPAAGKTSPVVNLLQGKLADGQIAYVVEAFYQQTPLIGSVNLGGGIQTPALSPNLYSMTVF
ncbi:TadE/TadG family type IV pilus assembly protein [Paraburkholderia sp. FT54]|uniref:TadE/TadG family type IV pilus assembly protein n=1 Tax=Paraburkholderia sp. FT54 TaxID=3074437 RepID=UPI0028778EFB|nr:TadE/TadG family type IV pilus assembly protein [Paraburkholderia sp. FT54]WNC93837.1 TadE/TadG family type IV pilus assembly protein [Paraburkholderia sp. FT54]